MDDPLFDRFRRALAPEFELERRLAAGGMGIVYRAREVALDRLVAIKLLRPELATAVARERFLHEARLLARLQHPNIVSVHRADERDGLSFYVMDFIEGPTLADRLAAGRLPTEQVLRLSRDLVEALAAAHADGIIHRDVKPQNIFFIGHRALLGDFGIAHDATSDPQDLTEEGALIGTRAYMAPEQLRGEPATERSDQYSAAAVLFEAASGRRWKALEVPADADWRGVPRPMVPLLRGGLAADPARRWSSMREARRVFDRARFRRQRLLPAAGIVVAAAMLGRLGWNLVFPPTPPASRYDLAILPFTAAGSTADSLATDIAEATDINLYAFPRVTRASIARASQWRAEHPSDDLAAARRALGADRVLSGSVEQRTDTLWLRLTLSDSTGDTPLPVIRMPGGGAQAGALGERAAKEIGLFLSPDVSTDTRNLASSNTEAVGKFVEGEALFDEDAWHFAADRYAEAISADPDFALARWRLMVARLWAREYSWKDASAVATCCAMQLPPLERGLVRAMSDTNLLARFQAFDSLEAQQGDEGSLPLLFASDLFHRGPLVGRSLTVSLDMFERAIRYSPGGTPAPAYDHMIWGWTRLGERARANAWLAARSSLGSHAPGEPPIPEFLQLGYDFRWVPWRAKLKLWYLNRAGSEDDLKQLGRFFRFSATFDLPEGQDAVGRLIATRLLSIDRASGLEARGLAHFTWGRPTEGVALIDSAAKYFGTDEAELQRWQWRLLLPQLGAGHVAESEVVAARRWLEGRAEEGPLASRARWTLALDALQRGDTTTARMWTGALAAAGQTDSASGRLAVLAGAILEGTQDPHAALAATEPLLRFDSPAPGNDIFTRSLLHLSRARWFESTGDLEAAQREILWYENSDTYAFPVREAQKMEVDAVASVSARVTRARLLLVAGKSDVACPMLARVRQLWQNAEASLAAARAMADSLHREECR